jgi:hypothetical protein
MSAAAWLKVRAPFDQMRGTDPKPAAEQAKLHAETGAEDVPSSAFTSRRRMSPEDLEQTLAPGDAFELMPPLRLNAQRSCRAKHRSAHLREVNLASARLGHHTRSHYHGDTDEVVALPQRLAD